ncbi:P-loop containing nucleoside triphosphate hydrolase protein [Thelonectria olida]|uniref:P-loop containing nucleoside triphosphate hydrolase protein n=1 Tax=Thelonectria olida TaxID=1576542 RepID=A0A9P9AIZ7_9HYPO|nr:P-loop containing nucleoside triphosphate hydrolase protein [Thelonectria olida]
MSSVQPVIPSQDLIDAAKKILGDCSDQRAIRLLEKSNNDLDRIKIHQEDLLKRRSSDSRPLREHPIDTPPREEDVAEKPNRRSNPPSQPRRAVLGQGEDRSRYRPSKTHISGPHSLSPSSNSSSQRGAPTPAPDEGTATSNEWDFTLPWILDFMDIDDNPDSFQPDALVRIIQPSASVPKVRDYLEFFGRDVADGKINEPVRGFPAIFYAVETDQEAMVRLLINFGANVSVVHSASRTPLLAYAILKDSEQQTHSTAILSTLLSTAASPHVIPAETFTPFTRDAPTGSTLEADRKIEVTELTRWCTDATRLKLAKATNLTQRYYLDRAAKLKPPSLRHKQITKIKKATGLLGVPYFLIGQTIAVDLLIENLLAHLLMPTEQPLVLCFAGPSGHGKTELARQLQTLLSLDMELVDCTTMSRESELFGPRKPWVGAKKGSPLNNFLVQHAGERCLVFLDEFEKTSEEIHQALLLPFGNGEYEDRRNREKVDCSKTIWILATNALDDTILEFYEQNEPKFDGDEAEKDQAVKQLLKELQGAFLNWFDAPVTGRVSGFVPFLPFSAGEQAVITHRELLKLDEQLRGPINLLREELIGNIILKFEREATLCELLAKDYYCKELGARSLIQGVKKVRNIIVKAYLEEEEEIQENDMLQEFIITVQDGEIVGRARKTFYH